MFADDPEFQSCSRETIGSRDWLENVGLTSDGYSKVAAFGGLI